jgi:hypothetical protein
MIYGIYLKSKPKNKWQLMSVATSQEMAVNDLKETLKQAHAEGNEQVMVAEQLFDSAFWIPHYLDNVKEQKILYN